MVPNPDDLLALEVEDLAGVLLTHLNTHGGHFIPGRISHPQFFEKLRTMRPLGEADYGERQPEVNMALMEAWAWLEREGLIVRDPVHNLDQFFISRRGQRLRTRQDVDAYRKASLLPKAQLHPLIASRVYPAFLRGDYSTAIFEAFKEVEIAVRDACKFPHELIGDKLMRAAFAPAENNQQAGPLTDTELPLAEQKAMAHLFAGAFGVYRNSTGHRHVPTHPEDSAEVIVFASQLLRVVDRSKRPESMAA